MVFNTMMCAYPALMVSLFITGWNANIKWVKLEEAEKLSKTK